MRLSWVTQCLHRTKNKIQHVRHCLENETRKTITQVYDQISENHHPSDQYINPLFKQYA
jgi:hypothetical protein